MLGCRAIYHDGWKAVANHPIATPHPEATPWELYHVAGDASECHDLAVEEPERLAELEALWWDLAERHQVLPLDAQPFDSIFGDDRPYIAPRTTYTYWPGGGPVPEEHAVNVRNRTHEVTAHLEPGPAPGPGVLIVQGSVLGGWILFVGDDGHLHYAHNLLGLEVHRGRTDEPVPDTATTLGFRFEKTAEHAGTVTLLVDGEHAGTVEVPRFTPVRFAITGDGVQCGEHWGVPVVADYVRPFRFTGGLQHVTVWVDGDPHVDPAAEAAEAIRQQ
jgi:arylsulfatase